MTDNTGRKVMNYIYANFYERYNTIYIDFLDGEPLTNFDVLKTMVTYGNKLEKDQNSHKFVYRFTTNGSLLNKDIVGFAIENSIYFNISVDGLPETHDKNRIYHDGTGTSSDVFNKLELVTGLNNVGIVSTYSSSTYDKIVEGTKYLISRGFKHIELNFCMGKVDSYDIKRLEPEFSKAILLFFERYERKDFSCTYVILDRVLQNLFIKNINQENCIHPYKITYNGLIKSCDRIPEDHNKVLANIRDTDFRSFDLSNCHYCSNNETEECKQCNYRYLCIPCNIYMNDLFDDKMSIEPPVFCAVMKTIINNAINFYNKNKNNLVIAMHFNPALRDSFLNKKYEVIYK